MTDVESAAEPHSCDWCQWTEVDARSKTEVLHVEGGYRWNLMLKFRGLKALRGAQAGCAFFQEALLSWLPEEQLLNPAFNLEDWYYEIQFSYGLKSDKHDIQKASTYWICIDGSKMFGPRYSVLAAADDPAARNIHSRPVAYNFLSSDCTQWMVSMLRECEASHSACHAIEGPVMPARLLGIPTSSGESWCRLHIPSVASFERYAALSYCWGDIDQDSLLNDETLKRWSSRSGLMMERLPATLKDAIVTTRKLGIRFLWVDRLCILQSDNLEKAREISKMDAIFKNACIVISAARAAHCNEGFLDPLIRPNPRSLSFKLPIACRDGQLGSMILFQEEHVFGTSDPIDRRAWTMQEHMLSRQMFRFGAAGLQWSCKQTRHIHAMEEEAVQDYRQRELEKQTKLNLLLDDPARHVLQWTKIIAEYVQRSLKDATDQLLAVAGIAQRFGEPLGDVYLAGLWLSHLPHGLLWRIDPRSSRPSKHHAPSWSWPSKEPAHLFNNLLNLPLDDALEIQSYSIEPKYEGLPYGQISSGSLTLRGRLVGMMLDPITQTLQKADPDVGNMDPDFVDVAWDVDEAMSGQVEGLATGDFERVLEPVWCLQIALYDEEDDYGPAGLILSKHEARYYQRLGVYTYDRGKFSYFVDDPEQLDKETDYAMRQEQRRGLSGIEPLVIEIR